MEQMRMFKLIKLLFISLIFVSTLSFAEDEPKSVIVSGTGGTREIALNNAFRHAVEQAVGLMVSSESYVKNLKDIQDKIFLVSNGFIEQYKVLAEDHDTTGYAVTISAVVRQKQLKTAMSSATNTEMPLDGGALFANQMLKEDKTNSYAKVIANLIDDLIANGFEYKYDSPKVKPIEGNTGAYEVVLPNFKAYLKKDWLSGLSKYRDKIGDDEEVFQNAIKTIQHIDIAREWNRYMDSIHRHVIFLVELKDSQGNTISQAQDREINYTNYLYIKRLLGLYDNSSFRYPNITDKEREIAIGYFDFDAIDATALAKINKVIIQAVAVKDYGGKLPIYNIKSGAFE
jgi:hypothetical protein